MARKLSIRKTGRRAYQVGPRGHEPIATVRAPDKRAALADGKRSLRDAGTFEVAARASFRHYAHVEHGVAVDTRPTTVMA